MKCDHDIAEKEVACADGMCPLCAAAEVALLKDGHAAVVREYDAEIARWEAWVSDLQSGMYVNCVYCGHRYGPGETTPVSMADALKAHIAQCPKHPMSHLLVALKASVEAADSHYAHWDSKGTAGANCPACKARSEANKLAYAAIAMATGVVP